MDLESERPSKYRKENKYKRIVPKQLGTEADTEAVASKTSYSRPMGIIKKWLVLFWLATWLSLYKLLKLSL